MRFQSGLLVATMLAGSTAAVFGDTVFLRNGKKLEGTFLGGTVSQLQFQDTASGKTTVIKLGDIEAIEFSAPPPPPPPQKTPGAAVQLPAGTPINIRLSSAINVDLAKPGQLYHGSIDDPVMVGGTTIIPRGADVTMQAATVKQAGRFKGSDEISLKINSISIKGKQVDVVTDPLTQKGGSEGKKTARRTAGTAGLGAAIGGIAGGGKGAAIGAVAGAGVGAAASAGGQTLMIPAETRLQFRLAAAVNIK